MGVVVSSLCASDTSLPPICDEDLATPGPLRTAFQLFQAGRPAGQENKLSARGFARAFRLRDDVFLHRLLCMWDRNGDGEVDFREFVVGLSTWETNERGFGRLRLAFRLLDNDGDNLLGRRDLQLAADAAEQLGAPAGDAAAPRGRSRSPTRGPSRPPPVPIPNPFAALFRELDQRQVQAVDFKTFVTLEAQHPAICASATLIWSTLQPYAAAAAALVAHLRLRGHLEFLAEPEHGASPFVTAKLRRWSSGKSRASGGSSRSLGGAGAHSSKSLAVASNRSSAASGVSAGGGGGGGARRGVVPTLVLPSTAEPWSRPPQHAHSAGAAARRASPEPRQQQAADAEEDDLDGFAAWAARRPRGYEDVAGDDEYDHAGGAAPLRRNTSPTRAVPLQQQQGPPWERAASFPRAGIPGPRGRLPPPPQLLQLHQPPPFAAHPPPHLMSYASMRAASPTRPPPYAQPYAQPYAPPPPVEPAIAEVITALRQGSPRRGATGRIDPDYYARLSEVAAMRQMGRSATFS